MLYQISASLTQIIRPKLYLRRDNARLPFNFWVLYCYESMNWVYRILHAMTCFCESRYIIIKFLSRWKETLPPAGHTNVVWPMSRNHYNHLSSNGNQINVRLSLYLKKITHALNLTTNQYIVCMYKNKYRMNAIKYVSDFYI